MSGTYGTTIAVVQTTSLQLLMSTQNPVLITNTGAVDYTGSPGNGPEGESAIYGSTLQSWSISNLGTVEGDASGSTQLLDSGIDLRNGGMVANGSQSDTLSLIQGVGSGVAIYGSGATILNFGTIESSKLPGQPPGVIGNAILMVANSEAQSALVVNGSVTDTSALIAGGFGSTPATGSSNSTAIDIFESAVVQNFATISDTGSFAAIEFDDYATILNGSALDTKALIECVAGDGIFSAGSAVNYGTIVAGKYTFDFLKSNGRIVNYGTIIGGESAIRDPAANTTVVNDGLIEGLSGTAIMDTSHDLALLEVGTAGRFIGTVMGGGELELLAGPGSGTINGIGTSFAGFQTIAFDTAASWLISGTSIGLAHGQIIDGFGTGDTIILAGFTATSETYISGIGLELRGGTITETLDISGSFTTGDFTLTSTVEGTEIVVCYLRGTRILTPTGETPIEALAVGDLVHTRFNGIQQIKWIGRQRFHRRFVNNNRDQIPVRITAGALGGGRPIRDLFVSPGHSMLLENTLVLAKSLVNGITITQDFSPEEIDYYQIELTAHDCIAAEGSWSETYADFPGLRAKFHNAASFAELYPDTAIPSETALCAPRYLSGRGLAAALRPIVARAAEAAQLGQLIGWIDRIGEDGCIHGWAQDLANPELAVLLEVLWDDQLIDTILACDYRGDLAQARPGTGRCSFMIDPPADIAFNFYVRFKIRRAADGANLPFSHGLSKAA